MDPVLSSQFFEPRSTRGAPERRLLTAALLDAAVHLSRFGSPGAAEAERWIHSTGADEGGLSFGDVCEALGFEPDVLARGLLAWQARRSAATLPRRHVGVGGRPRVRRR